MVNRTVYKTGDVKFNENLATRLPRTAQEDRDFVDLLADLDRDANNDQRPSAQEQ